jgi:hypothetical protein
MLGLEQLVNQVALCVNHPVLQHNQGDDQAPGDRERNHQNWKHLAPGLPPIRRADSEIHFRPSPREKNRTLVEADSAPTGNDFLSC